MMLFRSPKVNGYFCAFNKIFAEHAFIARCFPIKICEPYRIAEGINFVFSFPDYRIIQRIIVKLPVTIRILFEGVGIGLRFDIHSLPFDNALD